MTRKFGGNWTKQKLDIIENYLKAYLKVMKKQPFGLGYIDAFAGEGSVELATHQGESLFDVNSVIKGSTIRALLLDPGFDGYVFIEKDPKAVAKLERLKQKYPDKRIDIRCRDANVCLKDICQHRDWKRRRAVLFIDPAGTQVDWDTIVAVADTQAIDVWVWFPLGVGVNRLLLRSGDINPSWEDRLNRVFGTSDWKEEFYKIRKSYTLFGEEERLYKTATPKVIAEYYNYRLNSAFKNVAPNPKMMYNSQNNPIYLLCFAAGNPKGSKIAIRIAEYLLNQV